MSRISFNYKRYFIYCMDDWTDSFHPSISNCYFNKAVVNKYPTLWILKVRFSTAKMWKNVLPINKQDMSKAWMNNHVAQESVGWNYLSISKLQWLHHWSLGKEKKFHLTLYDGCNYIFILWLKLIHASKRGSWIQIMTECHTYWDHELIYWATDLSKYVHKQGHSYPDNKDCQIDVN